MSMKENNNPSRFTRVESNMGVLFVHNHDTLEGRFDNFKKILEETLKEKDESIISIPNPSYPDEYADFVIVTRLVEKSSLEDGSSIVSTPHTAIEIYVSEDYLAEKTNRAYTSAPASLMKHVFVLGVYGDVEANPTILMHTQRELSTLKKALGHANGRGWSTDIDVVDICEEVFNKVVARI